MCSYLQVNSYSVFDKQQTGRTIKKAPRHMRGAILMTLNSSTNNFFNLCGLTGSLAKVEQLGASYLTMSDNFDIADNG